MHPFKKLIYSLRNENTLELTQFCFEGIWSAADPLHPTGGSVTYIDQYGATETMAFIFSELPYSVMAVSIVSTIGVNPVSCETVPPPQVYYAYQMSSETSNNTETVCSWSAFGMILYSDSPFLDFGSRLYMDIGLLTPYIGNSLYRLAKDGTTMKYVRITSSGYITNIGDC